MEIITLPLQITIHSLAIAVGIISPKASYQMMQAASKPLTWISQQENKIWQEYKTPQVILR